MAQVHEEPAPTSGPLHHMLDQLRAASEDRLHERRLAALLEAIVDAAEPATRLDEDASPFERMAARACELLDAADLRASNTVRYDPSTGKITAVSAMRGVAARDLCTLTTDGRVRVGFLFAAAPELAIGLIQTAQAWQRERARVAFVERIGETLRVACDHYLQALRSVASTLDARKVELPTVACDHIAKARALVHSVFPSSDATPPPPPPVVDTSPALNGLAEATAELVAQVKELDFADLQTLARSARETANSEALAALAALQKSEEAVQNLRGALAVARTTFDVLAEDEGGLPSQAWDGYACVRAALGDPVRPEDRPRPTMTSTWVVGGPPSDVQLLTGLCGLVDAMRQWASAEGGDGMHDEARPAYDAARALVDVALARGARRQAGLPLPPPAPTADLRALVEGCVRAMGRWGHDTDGVHPVAWAAYKHGRALLGDPVRGRPRAEADAIVDALVAGLPPLYRTSSRVDAGHGLYTLHFPRGVWISLILTLEGEDEPQHYAVHVSTEHHDALAGPDPVYFVQGTTPNDPYPADGLRNLISIEGAVAYLTQRLTEEVPALPLAPEG